MQSARRQLLALALVVLAAPLRAQDESRPVDIHAYGDWTYGRTNHNVFLAGSPDGDYERLSMALNLSKRIDDKLSIHSQGFVDSHGETEASLDYAFVEYKLDDLLSFRIGQVKHPFGIYTEIFDVGTLRPFIDLPQALLLAAPDERVYLVLVIDDESDARVILKRAFEDLGCTVVTAASVDEGLALARTVSPQMITIDLMMPHKNGWEALKELQSDPLLRHIPLVVVSAVASENRAHLFGALDSLEKPVTREGLARVIARSASALNHPTRRTA